MKETIGAVRTTVEDIEIQARQKHIIVFLGLTVAALGVLLWITLGEGPSGFREVSQSFAKAIFSTIAAGGLLGIVYESYLRKDIIRMNDQSSDRVIDSVGEATDRIGLSNSLRNLELGDVAPDANGFDFEQILTKSTNLIITLNDGRTWISQRITAIEQRLKDPKKTTVVILVSPDSSFVESLTTKVKTTSEKFREKIGETIQDLTDHIFRCNQSYCFGTFIADDIQFSSKSCNSGNGTISNGSKGREDPSLLLCEQW
jgi:hypothetical protein